MNAFKNTPYKYSTSLKQTTNTESIKPIPIENTNKYNSTTGISTIVKEKLQSVAIITMNKATMDKTMVTKDDSTLDTGKIYFGKYTFLIRAAPLIIELIAIVVDSEKNPNNNWPANKYTA